ncbi:MAG: TolC family protein [Myxococcota bacterium]
MALKHTHRLLLWLGLLMGAPFVGVGPTQAAGAPGATSKSGADASRMMLEQAARRAIGRAPALPSTSQPMQMNYEQALRRALEASMLLAEARAYTLEVMSEKRTLRAWDPLRMKLSQVPLGSLSAESKQLELGMELRLPRPAVRAAQRERVSAEIEEAQALEAAVEVTLRESLRAAFERLGLLQAQRRVMKEVLEIHSRRVSLTQARLAQQQATQLDVSLSQLNQAEVQWELQALETDQQVLERWLCTRLELTCDGLVHFEPLSVPPESILPTQEALLEVAMQRRPELLAQAAQVRAAQAGVLEAQRLLLPHVRALELDYVRDPGAALVGDTPWRFSLGLEIPLPGLEENRVEKARAVLLRQIRGLDEALQQVTFELADARQKLGQALQKAQQFQAGPYQAMLEAEKALEVALEAGQVERLDVVVLQEKHASLRLKEAALWREVGEARLALRALIGGWPGESPQHETPNARVQADP